MARVMKPQNLRPQRSSINVSNSPAGSSVAQAREKDTNTEVGISLSAYTWPSKAIIVKDLGHCKVSESSMILGAWHDERTRRLRITHQKKISRMAFFARRGDRRRSRIVALSVRMSDAVRFLCERWMRMRWMKRDFRFTIDLPIDLSHRTYDEDFVDGRVETLLVDPRYLPQLLHHFVHLALGNEPPCDTVRNSFTLSLVLSYVIIWHVSAALSVSRSYVLRERERERVCVFVDDLYLVYKLISCLSFLRASIILQTRVIASQRRSAAR